MASVLFEYFLSDPSFDHDLATNSTITAVSTFTQTNYTLNKSIDVSINPVSALTANINVSQALTLTTNAVSTLVASNYFILTVNSSATAQSGLSSGEYLIKTVNSTINAVSSVPNINAIIASDTLTVSINPVSTLTAPNYYLLTVNSVSNAQSTISIAASLILSSSLTIGSISSVTGNITREISSNPATINSIANLSIVPSLQLNLSSSINPISSVTAANSRIIPLSLDIVVNSTMVDQSGDFIKDISTNINSVSSINLTVLKEITISSLNVLSNSSVVNNNLTKEATLTITGVNTQSAINFNYVFLRNLQSNIAGISTVSGSVNNIMTNSVSISAVSELQQTITSKVALLTVELIGASSYAESLMWTAFGDAHIDALSLVTADMIAVISRDAIINSESIISVLPNTTIYEIDNDAKYITKILVKDIEVVLNNEHDKVYE